MSKIQLSPEYKELLEAIPADTRRKLSFHDVRQFIKHYQPQIKAQQARIVELERGISELRNIISPALAKARQALKEQTDD